jgi:hypothetical protein
VSLNGGPSQISGPLGVQGLYCVGIRAQLMGPTEATTAAIDVFHDERIVNDPPVACAD